jgi:hypothetical protein
MSGSVSALKVSVIVARSRTSRGRGVDVEQAVQTGHLLLDDLGDGILDAFAEAPG